MVFQPAAAGCAKNEAEKPGVVGAAPNLWNSFLLHIRSSATHEHFKSRLKTNLFSLAVLLNWEWFYPKRFYYCFKIISDVLEF